MPHSEHSIPITESCINGTATTKSVGDAYWNNNMPSEAWTSECPEFLVGLGEKSIRILSQKDIDYHILSWEESKHLVEINRIDLFHRVPSDLRRYLEYIFNLTREYGSVLKFVQHERLRWDDATPSGQPPFSNPSDYKILYNDWPYGIDKNITHLVVWTKFLIDEDPETGDLTVEARQLLEDFVSKTFCGKSGVDRKDVVWFKNWRSLKSVHAIEHLHVMIYNSSPEFLRRITNGDKPMSEVLSAK